MRRRQSGRGKHVARSSLMRMNRRVLRLTALSFLLPVPVAMAVPGDLASEQVLAMGGVPVNGVGDAVLPRVLPVEELAQQSERIDQPSASLTDVVKRKKQAVAAASKIARSGIPVSALRAYRAAEATMKIADPSCELSWPVLAGIGRIESDHGRYAGAVLRNNGLSTPRIIGVPLNGVGNVAAISDTDNGALDGDQRWDRAVGPMQFIPSTWAMVGVDGDGDGERNPHDIADAALAAAAYLCVGDQNLSTPQGLHDALYSYNHSEEYVALVAAVADAYKRGVVALPLLTATLQLPTGSGSAVDLESGQGVPVGGGDGADKAGKRGDGAAKKSGKQSDDDSDGGSDDKSDRPGGNGGDREQPRGGSENDSSGDDDARNKRGDSDGDSRGPKGNGDKSKNEDESKDNEDDRDDDGEDGNSGPGNNNEPESDESDEVDEVDEVDEEQQEEAEEETEEQEEAAEEEQEQTDEAAEEEQDKEAEVEPEPEPTEVPGEVTTDGSDWFFDGLAIVFVTSDASEADLTEGTMTLFGIDTGEGTFEVYDVIG